ncbi:MAG TPA: helix-turn-helix transcriptional regulator [Puia sp.]|nr:helix-turn-helix transcriptional regulator [Puia sp.]
MKFQPGQNIKKLRELKNLTQMHMASELEMSISNYSNIENGKTDIKFSRLQRIADILQVDVRQIFQFNPADLFSFHPIPSPGSGTKIQGEELVKQLQIKDKQIQLLLQIIEKIKSSSFQPVMNK